MVKKNTPVELAHRWGIAYIVDASNHDVWKETFMALGTATHYLDHKEEEILDEEEEFQTAVKKQHSNMKKKLIGQGKEPNSAPFVKKPSYKRSKSAPPGFGGS